MGPLNFKQGQGEDNNKKLKWNIKSLKKTLST